MPSFAASMRRILLPREPTGLLIGIAILAVLLVAERQKLHWLGSNNLTTGPADSYTLANRSDAPCLARVSWGENNSVPIFLPSRSTTDFDLPVAASGMTRTDVWHVLPDAPGTIERVLEWTTRAGEEFAVTIAADGSETHQASPSFPPSGKAHFYMDSRDDRPVQVLYEDLEAAGGVQVRDGNGQPEPVWIGPGVQGGIHGTGLEAGRDVHLRYRIADLKLAASVKIDSREGTSHEIVIGSNGSAGGGSLSLLTRAGF
jgi:hypothetical protein